MSEPKADEARPCDLVALLHEVLAVSVPSLDLRERIARLVGQPPVTVTPFEKPRPAPQPTGQCPWGEQEA